jgi:RNA polymerase sigma-70 factor (sigma-E family)
VFVEVTMRLAATARDERFDDLFRSEWRRTVATARRIVGPGDEAEELAAEAFTRAYDRWSSVRRQPAPAAWVLRVTVNLALDQARRRRVDLVDEASTTHSTDPAQDRVAERLALAAALGALSPKQRHAIALRYLAGCQEDEVAAALGVSTGTVKTHLRRGLDHLRRQLGEEAPVALGA